MGEQQHDCELNPADDFKEAYRLQPGMVDGYLRLNKLTPSLPRAVEPEVECAKFTLGQGSKKSFIQLRPVFPWPQPVLPPALAPDTTASLPWQQYTKRVGFPTLLPVIEFLLPSAVTFKLQESMTRTPTDHNHGTTIG